MINDREIRPVGMVIESITAPLDADEQEILAKAAARLKRVNRRGGQFDLALFKRSVDARNRDNIRFVYSVLATSRNGNYAFDEAKLAGEKIRLLQSQEIDPELGREQLMAPPLVVGMGPAGLFSALMLARYGYRPIIIDRGDSIADRTRSVASFYESKNLDTDSNVQFGAGGAGTFSDGKLMTRIHDPKCSFVLKTFVEHGAPADILLLSKPHVGTDLLRGVVDRC